MAISFNNEATGNINPDDTTNAANPYTIYMDYTVEAGDVSANPLSITNIQDVGDTFENNLADQYFNLLDLSYNYNGDSDGDTTLKLLFDNYYSVDLSGVIVVPTQAPPSPTTDNYEISGTAMIINLDASTNEGVFDLKDETDLDTYIIYDSGGIDASYNDSLGTSTVSGIYKPIHLQLKQKYDNGYLEITYLKANIESHNQAPNNLYDGLWINSGSDIKDNDAVYDASSSILMKKNLQGLGGQDFIELINLDSNPQLDMTYSLYADTSDLYGLSSRFVTSGNIQIAFYSDSSQTKKGFEIRITAREGDPPLPSSDYYVPIIFGDGFENFGTTFNNDISGNYVLELFNHHQQQSSNSSIYRMKLEDTSATKIKIFDDYGDGFNINFRIVDSDDSIICDVIGSTITDGSDPMNISIPDDETGELITSSVNPYDGGPSPLQAGNTIRVYEANVTIPIGQYIIIFFSRNYHREHYFKLYNGDNEISGDSLRLGYVASDLQILGLQVDNNQPVKEKDETKKGNRQK